jgi:putative oxidoreductase
MIKQKVIDFLKSNKVHIVSQLVLGGIFVYASLGKIFSPAEFMIAVRNYRIFPPLLVSVTAYVLPWLELIFGVLLVLNIYTRPSAAVLSLLLLVFIGVILSALIRGINIDCGCFLQQLNKGNSPPLSALSSVYLIVRDILFLIPGIIILFFREDKGITKNGVGA